MVRDKTSVLCEELSLFQSVLYQRFHYTSFINPLSIPSQFNESVQMMFRQETANAVNTYCQESPDKCQRVNLSRRKYVSHVVAYTAWESWEEA